MEADNKTKSEKPQEQEEQSEKTLKRRRLIKNIFRNKRQIQADRQFQELCEKDKQLFAGFNHHRFGAFCLQAEQTDKALEHITKAKQIIDKRFPFSNSQMNLGNLQAQKKNYKGAIEHYLKVIQTSPHKNPKEYLDKDQVVFSSKLNSFTAYVDAHNNIGVMYVQMNEFEKGFEYCSKSLELKPGVSEAIINFTDILRQLGKKQEALDLTWKQVIQYTQKNVNPEYKGFQQIQIKPWKPNQQQKQLQNNTQGASQASFSSANCSAKKINILCVKWGTRYSADYVNKLYAGVKRNTSWDITFYCFTDDATGLNENIQSKELEQGWKKWWGKATLFNFQVKGKKFYIDLDMIITGCLDPLFQYEGQFATLRTGDLACEKNHKQGYNSSVMIWEGDILKPVYEALKSNFQVINKFIVRFDFWLEMTINNADYIQKIFPGKVIDFLADAQKQLPEGSAVVCFARKPKPEDYPAEWISKYWVL